MVNKSQHASSGKESRTRKYLKRSKHGLFAVRLHLELRDPYFSDNEKIVLKRYGESETGDSISRDILIPSDMPLHNLHYLIQRLFGWQNSHLRRFYLPDERYSELTGDTVRGWAALVGDVFQPPSEGEADLFWDDDYKSGSILSWLRRKYRGPYEYGGFMEIPDVAKKDVQELLDYYKKVDVKESFFSYLERKEKDGDAKIRILRQAPLIDLTIEELHSSIYLGYGTDYLLERLLVDDVIALESEELAANVTFPLTHELTYNYDFGDNWEILIRKHDHCDDLLAEHKAAEEEIDEAVTTVIEKHYPVLLHRNGLPVFDDVGGLGGYADFLWDVYENEDKEASSDIRAWARSLGWNTRKTSIKDFL